MSSSPSFRAPRICARLLRLVALSALGAAMPLAACREPAPEPETSAEPSPATPDTAAAPPAADEATPAAPTGEAAVIVARAGEVTVSLADYRRALERGKLNGQPHSERTLADPTFQRNLLARLVKREALRLEAERRGIAMTRADARAYLAADPGFGELAAMDDAALERFIEAERGVAPADLWRFLEEDARVERMTEVLLAELDDEALWQRYAAERTRIALELVRLLNVPSPAEISHAVETRRDDIEAFYELERMRYVQPELATVRRFLVAVPPDADDETVRQARERAEAFRRRALTEDFPALAERHSDDILSRANGGLLQPTPRTRMALAFTTPVGEVSEVERTRAGFHFIRVEARAPAQTRALDAALEREIASELVQRDGAAPSVARAAEQVLEAWRRGDPAALAERIAEHRADRFEVALFPVGSGGRLPGVGFLPRVHAAAVATTLEQPLSAAPIVDGAHVYVFRLTAREEADRLSFAAEREAYRAAVVREERPRILWRWLDAKVGPRIELDLRTLQRHWGVLQRDGTIERVEAVAPAP